MHDSPSYLKEWEIFIEKPKIRAFCVTQRTSVTGDKMTCRIAGKYGLSGKFTSTYSRLFCGEVTSLPYLHREGVLKIRTRPCYLIHSIFHCQFSHLYGILGQDGTGLAYLVSDGGKFHAWWVRSWNATECEELSHGNAPL